MSTLKQIHCSNIMSLVYSVLLHKQAGPLTDTGTTVEMCRQRCGLSGFLLNIIWKLYSYCPNESLTKLSLFTTFSKTVVMRMWIKFVCPFSMYSVLYCTVAYIALCLSRQQSYSICATARHCLKIKQPQLHYWLLPRNGTKDGRDPRTQVTNLQTVHWSNSTFLFNVVSVCWCKHWNAAYTILFRPLNIVSSVPLAL